MAKAYSYSRFSSREQAEGDSLRRQLAAAYAYAEAHGLELDTTMQDHGVSAFTGANRTRGALRSFLERIEAGEVERGSFLLIDSMDRLSRESLVDPNAKTSDLFAAHQAERSLLYDGEGNRRSRDDPGAMEACRAKAQEIVQPEGTAYLPEQLAPLTRTVWEHVLDAERDWLVSRI